MYYQHSSSAKNALVAWKGKKFAGTILNIEVKSETQGSEWSESPRAVTPPCFLQNLLPVANNSLKNSEQIESNLELSNEILNIHTVSNCFSNKTVGLERVCDDPFKKTQRGRKKKGESWVDPVQVVDKGVILAYEDLYKVEKLNKGKDGNCIVRCVACDRILKKKSIRSHAISELHRANRNK